MTLSWGKREALSGITFFLERKENIEIMIIFHNGEVIKQGPLKVYSNCSEYLELTRKERDF